MDGCWFGIHGTQNLYIIGEEKERGGKEGEHEDEDTGCSHFMKSWSLCSNQCSLDPNQRSTAPSSSRVIHWRFHFFKTLPRGRKGGRSEGGGREGRGGRDGGRRSTCSKGTEVTTNCTLLVHKATLDSLVVDRWLLLLFRWFLLYFRLLSCSCTHACTCLREGTS